MWDYPVALEPPFLPFEWYAAHPSPPAQIDDGQKPTLMSTLVDSLMGNDVYSEDVGSPDLQTQGLVEEIARPDPDDKVGSVHVLTLTLPSNLEVTAELSEHFLLSLSLCRSQVSFEISATCEHIAVQIACREHDLPHVEGSLRAYFPFVFVERTGHDVRDITAGDTLVIDFGLSDEFMRPLKEYRSYIPDPTAGILAVMDSLRGGEQVLTQILFSPTRQPWTKNILYSVSDGEGGSFFADAPEMIQLAREKTKRPLFAVIVRLTVSTAGRNTQRQWELARRVAGALVAVTRDPLSNELIPLDNDGYNHALHLNDVMRRTSHRSGMLLSSAELISLVHLPSASVHSSRLKRAFVKTWPAPQNVRNHKFVLGENLHQGERTLVTLNTSQRLRHIHIIGATGTGKSTLLTYLIEQDIANGEGLAVIDPHGDLVESIMGRVTENRLQDVILIDPADPDNHNGLNILLAKSEAEKNVIASDLVSAFKRLSTSWGDQMTSVLGNAIQAFLESDQGGGLADLRRFLIEADYRTAFLLSVHDPGVLYFWEKQYPLLRGNTQASILTRLDSFLRSKLVRKTVVPKVPLDFQEVIDQRKILLVRLAQGIIGEEAACMLGSLIVSKLHQAAMGRQSIAPEARIPFYLYIDEFQNFITPSLTGVLSGTRKYGLGLVLAHQELRQIWNQDTGVVNSLLSNPATRICFRVGDDDAQKLRDGFAHFASEDLQNLSVGEAIARTERREDDFSLHMLLPKEIKREVVEARRVEILRRARSIPVLDVNTKTAHEETKAVVFPPVPNPKQPLAFVSSGEHKKSVYELAPANESEDALNTATDVDASRPSIPRTEPEKESSQHRYLQTLVKRMAEERGYRATIEKPTPDGHGRIDIALEREGEQIACEISVTTTEEHEIQNIRKCLDAGYNRIVICSTARKKLEKIQALGSKEFSAMERARLIFFKPEELFAWFEQGLEKPEPQQQRIRGYRVKVEYQHVEEFEQKDKRGTIAQVVINSMKRLTEKD